MEMSIKKTKMVVIAKYKTRCKLVDQNVVDRTMNFNYLCLDIFNCKDLKEKSKRQATKTTQIADTLIVRTMLWNNKRMNIERKI